MDEKLAQLWWADIPRLLARLPGVSTQLLKDGEYLRRWPPISAWLPTGAFLFGLVSGIWHFDPGPTYTFSLVLMALMIVIASSGAMVGVWLCIGYALADFFLYGHFDSQSDINYLITAFSLLLTYVLLALLLVRAVFLANVIARRALARIKLPSTGNMALHAVLQGLILGALVWVWVHSVPSLIRPAFTWNGGYPPTAAMRPLQEDGGILVALGTIGGACRALAEFFANRTKPPQEYFVGQMKNPGRRFTISPIVKFVFQSCFATFMLSGLLATWMDALLLAIALFLIRYGSYFLADRLGPMDKFLVRLPLTFRLMAGLAASYFLANWIVTAMWSQTNTFRPVLVSVVLSLSFIVLLMPETRKKQTLASRPSVAAP